MSGLGFGTAPATVLASGDGNQAEPAEGEMNKEGVASARMAVHGWILVGGRRCGRGEHTLEQFQLDSWMCTRGHGFSACPSPCHKYAAPRTKILDALNFGSTIEYSY